MATQTKQSRLDKEKLFIPIADLLSALAHPVRLRIVSLLQEKEKCSGEGHCVCEITRILNLPQALISQHLAILRRAGMVKAKRMGNRISYSLADDRIGELLRIAQKIVSRKLKEISFLIGGA